jgi:hypothetical protein
LFLSVTRQQQAQGSEKSGSSLFLPLSGFALLKFTISHFFDAGQTFASS